jgi:uncharacterized phiE125 gp8 family phage protein
MRVVVVTPPSAEVVSVEQVKDHLNIDHSDDDALLSAYIAAATAVIDGPEGWLGRAIGEQVLEARLDDFGTGPILLPYPPLVTLSSVKYVDGDGVEQVLASTEYELLGSELDLAWGKSWPSVRSQREAVRIRYTAGYSGEIDPRIHAAILLMVGDLHANRETVVVGSISSPIQMSTTVENLLAGLRVYA